MNPSSSIVYVKYLSVIPVIDSDFISFNAISWVSYYSCFVRDISIVSDCFICRLPFPFLQRIFIPALLFILFFLYGLFVKFVVLSIELSICDPIASQFCISTFWVIMMFCILSFASSLKFSDFLFPLSSIII